MASRVTGFDFDRSLWYIEIKQREFLAFLEDKLSSLGGSHNTAAFLTQIRQILHKFGAKESENEQDFLVS